MLNSARVIAFVPASDLERCKAFYTGILGLELVSQDPFAVVLRAANCMVRVAKVGEFQPAKFTILGFEVNDIEEVTAGLSQEGIPCLRYSGMPQDARGIWISPSGARVAWFNDPEGNVLSLTQFPVPSH